MIIMKSIGWERLITSILNKINFGVQKNTGVKDKKNQEKERINQKSNKKKYSQKTAFDILQNPKMSNSLGQYQDIISRRLAGVGFSYYTADEIRKLSVKEITNPIAFDSLNRPLKGNKKNTLEKQEALKNGLLNLDF